MTAVLQQVAEGLPPSPADIDAGTVRWGHEVSVGYFPQDATGLINGGCEKCEKAVQRKRCT